MNWRVQHRRPWSFGYEDEEGIGAAMTAIRQELGHETAESFVEWIYETTQDTHGQYGYDIPAVLIEAFEFPALGIEQMMYVIDGVAKAAGVSPGTMLDEILLRASGRYNDDGTEIPE